MFLGSTFLVFGSGALFVLICRLAVDAFPVFMACTAGFWAYGTGAGPIGSSIIALVAGAGTLAAGWFLFASTRSGALRLLVIMLFAAPASITGYHVVLGLGRLAVPSEAWQHVFAALGALNIGLTSAVRLSGSDRAITADTGHSRVRTLVREAEPSTRCQAQSSTILIT
jgi:hypothetical protein